jgi:hypothetical protein
MRIFAIFSPVPLSNSNHLVPIRKLRVARPPFSIWKRAIFRKVKEIEDLSGGVVLYAAQSNPLIDAEIAEKGRFRTKTI